MYNCENKKTPAAKLQKVYKKLLIPNIPRIKKKKIQLWQCFIQKCRPQSGGMFGLGGLDYDAKRKIRYY